MLLTHAGALWGFVHVPAEEPVGSSGLLYHYLFSWAINSPLISAILAAAFVFVQALLVNNLADEFRLLNERSWLPAAFFVLVSSFLPEFLYLSPPLVAATFIPVAVRRVLLLYKAKKGTTLLFDAGFWILTAALFYPPAALLPIGILIGINVVRAFGFRDQVVYVSGTIVAFALAFMFFFWRDQGGLFLGQQLHDWLGLYPFRPDQQVYMLLKDGVLAVLFLWVVLNFGVYYSRTLIQTQKSISVLYWVLFFVLLGALFQPNISYNHFLLAMPAVGIFFSMSISSLRNRMMAEVFHLALLAMLVLTQYFQYILS